MGEDGVGRVVGGGDFILIVALFVGWVSIFTVGIFVWLYNGFLGYGEMVANIVAWVGMIAVFAGLLWGFA